MDFSKARKGDKLYSLRYGWVEFIIFKPDRHYPVLCRQGLNNPGAWTIEGKHSNADEIPDLYWTKPEIVGGTEPPKRTIKKKVEFWVNFYKDDVGIPCAYWTEKEADRNSSPTRIKCQKFETEIEVPEE